MTRLLLLALLLAQTPAGPVTRSPLNLHVVRAAPTVVVAICTDRGVCTASFSGPMDPATLTGATVYLTATPK